MFQIERGARSAVSGTPYPFRTAGIALAILLSLANAFGATSVHPRESGDPLPDPYMGWGLWAGSYNDFGAGRYNQHLSVADNTTAFGDNAPLFNWVLLDWPWSAVEPIEGRYKWDDFDAIVRYWSARNKQFVVRFWVTDDPGWNGAAGGVPCPDWLWAKGLHFREYVGNGGVKRRQPDYADASYETIYLPALKKLLAAFAERYDKPDTSVAFLQVMGYGHWADWATWYSHYEFPSVTFKHQLLTKIMEAYISTFQHIRLLEFAGADWDPKEDVSLDSRLYAKALDTAVNHGFGLIWTGFIDGLRGWDRDLKDKYWRTNPVISEANWAYEDMKAQQIHGTTDENLDVALGWHANYMHLYTDAIAYKKEMAQDRAFLERGLAAGGLGYRLAPIELSWPEQVPAGDLLMLKHTWVNRNVGRLYVRHPLKLYLTDEQGIEKFSETDTSINVTTWVSGEAHPLISVFHLPKTLSPGTYDVRVALVDGAGRPRIRLGIEGQDPSVRYRVGTIRILQPRAVAGCDKAYCPEATGN